MFSGNTSYGNPIIDKALQPIPQFTGLNQASNGGTQVPLFGGGVPQTNVIMQQGMMYPQQYQQPQMNPVQVLQGAVMQVIQGLMVLAIFAKLAEAMNPNAEQKPAEDTTTVGQETPVNNYQEPVETTQDTKAQKGPLDLISLILQKLLGLNVDQVKNDIATNKENIATNTQAIEDNQNTITQNTADINANQTNIQGVQDQIAEKEYHVADINKDGKLSSKEFQSLSYYKEWLDGMSDYNVEAHEEELFYTAMKEDRNKVATEIQSIYEKGLYKNFK